MPNKTTNDPLLAVPEVAERLQMHPVSIYRLGISGALPSVKWGGGRLFYASGVEAYLPQRRAKRGRKPKAPTCDTCHRR